MDASLRHTNIKRSDGYAYELVTWKELNERTANIGKFMIAGMEKGKVKLRLLEG